MSERISRELNTKEIDAIIDKYLLSEQIILLCDSLERDFDCFSGKSEIGRFKALIFCVREQIDELHDKIRKHIVIVINGNEEISWEEFKALDHTYVHHPFRTRNADKWLANTEE